MEGVLTAGADRRYGRSNLCHEDGGDLERDGHTPTKAKSTTVEYGATTSSGLSAPCGPMPGAGATAVPVTSSIGGLTAGTTYHFRVVASNPGGTAYGADQTFKMVL